VDLGQLHILLHGCGLDHIVVSSLIRLDPHKLHFVDDFRQALQFVLMAEQINKKIEVL